jgi:glucose-specific phosphotransferase system IIA component
MFDFFKKEKALNSVTKGTIIDITSVDDEVFSKKLLGEGFAITPQSNDFFSPANGTVSDVAETLHAYCITTDDGLEVLIHIGIDTVELKGNHFTSLVKKGQKLNAGTPIARAALDKIKNAGYKTTTMVVVTNSEILKTFKTVPHDSATIGTKAFIYKT